MILCHCCGEVFLPDPDQSLLRASQDHALDRHPNHARGGVVFTDLTQRPDALLRDCGSPR